MLDFPRSTVIASLNDALRRDPQSHGHVLFDADVMALIDTETPRKLAPVVIAQHEMLRLVRDCDSFTGSSRDRAEHRCGLFTFRARPLRFAIEYRDIASMGPARNPTNPATTRRILSIGLAEDLAAVA